MKVPFTDPNHARDCGCWFAEAIGIEFQCSHGGGSNMKTNIQNDNFMFFDGVVEDVIKSIKSVLISKGIEYSTLGDRFSNFKTAARKLNTSPERALLGMKIKHTVSIDDIVTKLDSGILPSVEMLNEKIGDEINYLILLKGLILERIERQGNV